MTVSQPSERVSGASIAKGGAWSFGVHIAVACTSLLLTPFVIRGLGDERYGIFRLIDAVIGYLAVADFGMGQTTTQFAAQAYARNERELEARTIYTGLLLAAIPSLVMLGSIQLLSTTMSRALIELPPLLERDLATSLRLAGVSLLFKNLAAVLNTPQLVRMRLREVAMINALGGVLQIAGVAGVVVLGGSLADCILAVAGANMLTFALHAGYALRLLPELRRPSVTLELVRPMLNTGISLFVFVLVGTALLQSDRLFLGRLASPEAIAHYSVALTLASLVAMVPRALKLALLPAMSRLHVESASELARMYYQVLRKTFLVSGAVGIVIGVLGRPFLGVWAGPAYASESALPFAILLLGFLLQSGTHVSSTVLTGVGRTRTLAVIAAAEVIPYLALLGFLTQHFHALGAAVAYTLRVAVDLVVTHLAARRAMVLTPDVRLRVPAMVVGGALVVAPCLFAALAATPPSTTFALGAISLAGYLFWGLYSLLEAPDRARIFAQLPRLSR